MTNHDGFAVYDVESTSIHGFRNQRGPYLKRKRLEVDYTNGVVDGFSVLDVADTEDEFRIVAPEVFESLPKQYKHTGHDREFAQSVSKPVCFIDGEGANEYGEPQVMIRSNGLKRSVQHQNYALLAATVEGAECNLQCFTCGYYRRIIGTNNHEQLSSRSCLEFILNLPADHIIVGYGLSYDVEHWLKDLPPAKMQILLTGDTNSVWWKRYRFHYIPNKVFTVTRMVKTRKVTRTIYDISGFFQTRFDHASRKWEVGTEAEYAFLEVNKDARSTFGDVSDERMQYNHLEGKHGIRLFRRIREEYTKLGLRVQRPVGAGSIASAMFRKHRIDNYLPTFQPIPTEVMLQAYIGGRFDLGRIGFLGTSYEYDINSAYPHIARNLPCLAHGRFEWSERYVPSPHSLWMVRWRDNENKWSPFPYRSDGGNHIRYYSSGIGYYYDSEVESALRLDSDIQILGGYRFIRECDERPFWWLESYYAQRQIMVQLGDFGEIIIKLGSNSVYGKLAQTKGKAPRYQNLIWAGMITSGTRAMLMDAVCKNPDSVYKLSTDAVFSSEPLDLPLGLELGQWKLKVLEDLLVLGNGIYHSANGETAKNRGYLKDGKYFNWEEIRKNYANGIPSVVTKHEFMKFGGAYHGKRMEERCTWVDEEQYLLYDSPGGKELRNGWIWPGVNPTPQVTSAPIAIDTKNLRVWE